MRPRVLVLDCDSDALIGLEHALEDAGFNTTTTWYVPEALALAESGAFEVFLVRSHPQIDAEAIRARTNTTKSVCQLVTLDHLRDHKNIVELLSKRPCVVRSRAQRPAMVKSA